MVLQHGNRVERAVMLALQKRFGSRVRFESDRAYALSDIDPNSYDSVEEFKCDYLVYSFLRKWKGLDTKIDLPQKTIDSWIAAERQCFRTNIRLAHEASTGFYSVAPRIISDAQRKIANVLGVYDPEYIERLYRFSGGATFDIKRGTPTPEKMKTVLSHSKSCFAYALNALADDPIWFPDGLSISKHLRTVDADKLIMVPKNSKTHRMISAGPTLNGFVQQGFGRYIRQRLKEFSVNLDDQTINQELAKRSFDDGLATIDLSMASDTLSIALVKLLLPSNWFAVLDATRVKFSQVGKNGKRVLLEKFSAMGNSFTFELESLIFWALASSVTESSRNVCSVYGDDIIVHSDDYPTVVEVLHWAGFKVNLDKSFSKPSKFYESCGKQYFMGVDVTPAYQKEVCNKPIEFVRLHNRLYRAAMRLDFVDRMQPIFSLVKRMFREAYPRIKIGDGPVVEFDEYFISLDGNLTDSITDRTSVWALKRVPKRRPMTGRSEELAYAYKLRHPSTLNVSRKGYAEYEDGERYVNKRIVVWRSAQVGRPT